MKKIFLVLLLSIMLISPVIAGETKVIFNGNFKEGATLYSKWYNNVSDIYGKDVYAIRGVQYCQKKTTCIAYNYHYDKICLRFNYRGNCISYKSIKVYDYSSCKTYKTTNVCTSTNSYPAICYNPNGQNTNKLNLNGNFFYSLDGINWNSMVYSDILLNNKKVQFKVTIPTTCRPNYDLDNAITVYSE